MKVQIEHIAVKTRGNSDMIDITDQAKTVLSQAGVKDGVITFFIAGSTAGITTVEYEPGLLRDLPDAFERIAPQGQRYFHDATWHDGNGHSHVRASLLGPSLTVPFRDGRLLLGTWQQIILVDFDIRSRHREVIMQILGE